MNLTQILESLRVAREQKKVHKKASSCRLAFGNSSFCKNCSTHDSIKRHKIIVRGHVGRWHECLFCARETEVVWTAPTNTT